MGHRVDFFPLLIALLVGGAVLLQLALGAAVWVRRWQFDRRQFELSQKLLRRQLDLPAEPSAPADDFRWNGFRKFLVHSVQQESRDCVSFELVPEDERPLPFYFPGQHITVRLSIPGQSRHVVRCYSLSDAPHPDRFRITVRAVSAPRGAADIPPGVASNFLHQAVRAGDRVDVKAPSGSFYLDLNDRRPTVFLAGGIGITPLMAMLNTLAQHKIKREVLLLYGVHDGEHHTFKKSLAEIAQNHPHIHIVTCYSQPLPGDQPRADFQVAGRVSIELVRKLVPSNQVPFYLCGPPSFMQTLFAELKGWGVPESIIQFEAFGPASIRETKGADNAAAPASTQAAVNVSFQKSAKQIGWSGDSQSILDLAEQSDISIPSGCRAGNCGTCQTRLIAGQVAYRPSVTPAECEAGHVLPCVAVPLGDIVVEA